MSFNNIKTKLRQDRGFTIVELLIVIVVIGILAAITIVSFNGVTARANTASAQSAAESAVKKIEAYNAEKASYPATFGVLQLTANSGTSYYLTGVTFATSAYAAQPGTPQTVMLYSCTTSGMIVKYWKYDGTPAVQSMNTGDTSGTCTTLVTT
ncbi:MAG: exported protein of unknown function [Candidatus Saccharibacteria bacterium]|nr:exported protein of unknown function [Candidatus Saccharibacteria bacterium]